MEPCQKRGTAESVATALNDGLIPGRVVGIGLSHTGTSTLNKLLVMLGCCLSTHNTRMPIDEDTPRHDAVVSALQDFQCVSDFPWNTEWRALSRAYPDSFFVLTRALTPLHYAISLQLRRERFAGGPVANLALLDQSMTVAMREYERHLAEVRAAYSRHSGYFELCFGCGDDMHTLARSLGVNMSRLPVAMPWEPVHEHAHPVSENARREDLLRMYAGRKHASRR